MKAPRGIEARLASSLVVACMVPLISGGCAAQQMEGNSALHDNGAPPKPVTAPPPKPVTARRAVSAPPPAPDLFARHSLPRGALLLRTGPEHTEGGRNVSQYDPVRLKRAAARKEWEPVDCGGGILCWLDTRWVDGELHVTMTLVGPQETLTPFMLHNKVFVLTFMDITNSTVMEFDAKPRDFDRAPSSANGGRPTVYFNSSIECPLEPYESCTRWSLHWYS